MKSRMSHKICFLFWGFSFKARYKKGASYRRLSCIPLFKISEQITEQPGDGGLPSRPFTVLLSTAAHSQSSQCY
jgi:hypothetical protein